MTRDTDNAQTPSRIWWKEAVAYQIYPRSFMDSNGDGIGDIPGIIQRLDYLRDLGVDVLWLCPIFSSPNDDNGYDISDYQGIMADFGTMEDFDRLLTEAHSRGLKVLLDLVVNHSSDEHAWFEESRASRDNPKRDWYYWRDGKPDGGLPNNWESIFNESAWTFDETTGQYYLHLFSSKQPDLNWENPDMRQAVYRMVRWWLDKGVDGFRIDAITHIRKDEGLPDMPNPEGLDRVPSFGRHTNRPGILQYISELCDETFNRYDCMTVGEANGVTLDDASEWVGADKGRFNMLFQFEQLKLWGTEDENRLNLPELRRTLTRWQTGLDGVGWNALFVENHDIPRIVSTWGNDQEYRQQSATAIAAMYFLMQGTPFIYQGEELGMTNYPFSDISDFDDVAVHNRVAKLRAEGWTDEDILHYVNGSARDHSRTPMQWDDSPHAGFSEGDPWLPVHTNHTWLNAAAQAEDADSVLNFYKRMIRLRKSTPTLVYGRYEVVREDDPQVYAYRRTDDEAGYLVLTNLSDEPANWGAHGLDLDSAALCLHNGRQNETPQPAVGNVVTLGPWEARVYRL